MSTPMNTPMEMPIITPVESWEPLDGEEVAGGVGDTGIVVPFPAINLLTTCSSNNNNFSERKQPSMTIFYTKWRLEFH